MRNRLKMQIDRTRKQLRRNTPFYPSFLPLLVQVSVQVTPKHPHSVLFSAFGLAYTEISRLARPGDKRGIPPAGGRHLGLAERKATAENDLRNNRVFTLGLGCSEIERGSRRSDLRFL